MRTALTLATVLLVLAGCGDTQEQPDAQDGDSPSATPSATATTSVSASPEPTATSLAPPSDATRLTVKGLAKGASPSIPYLTAYPDGGDLRSLVRPDGSTLQVPVGGIHAFTTTDDGAVVLVDDGDGTAAVVVDGSGAEVRREQARGYRLAVSADGSVVAWLRRDLATTVLGTDDGTTLRLPKAAAAGEIGAVSGGEHCPDVVDDGYGCTAYLNGEQAAEVHFVDSHGQSAPLGGPLIQVSDLNGDDRLLGLTSVDDLGSCSGVVGDHPGHLEETCDFTLTRFSPDGARVLGTDAYLDGFGQRTVAFLDSVELVPQQVFASTGRGASVVQTAWEDDDHVLAVVYERGRWAVLRLGVDGTAEVALGPVDGSDLDRPFVLPED